MISEVAVDTQVVTLPGFFPIVSHNLQVGIGSYYGTQEQGETIKSALISFGYLIKSVALTRCSFGQFADLIEMNHDNQNPKTAEVLKTLREVEVINRTKQHHEG